MLNYPARAAVVIAAALTAGGCTHYGYYPGYHYDNSYGYGYDVPYRSYGVIDVDIIDYAPLRYEPRYRYRGGHRHYRRDHLRRGHGRRHHGGGDRGVTGHKVRPDFDRHFDTLVGAGRGGRKILPDFDRHWREF